MEDEAIVDRGASYIKNMCDEEVEGTKHAHTHTHTHALTHTSALKYIVGYTISCVSVTTADP